MSGAIRRFLLWGMLILLAAAALGSVVLALGDRTGERATVPQLELTQVGEPAEFARALEPRQLHFPLDHGPHLEYQTEWWYYVGNLQTPEGRHFGFQLTFFRRGLQPGEADRASSFGANHIYSAHLALTDTKGGQHRAWERYSRGAFGLAGAQASPYRLWLDDWSAESLDLQANVVLLSGAEQDVSLDLTLRAAKPPALHGEGGLSRKGADPGNASYYVSITRMTAEGRLTLGGETHEVQGEAWFDHEWGTSALGPLAVGWDWFGLQLEDGRELMAFRIRQLDGSIDPASAGTLIGPDGDTEALTTEQVMIESLGSWTSPENGATYPSGWRLRIPDRGLDLTLQPQLRDQENRLSVVYWEGAVRVDGTSLGDSIGGAGYVELTGYLRPLEGDF